MASDLLNGASMPLETTNDFETMRARLREAYVNGIDGLLDRCLEQLILPAEQGAVLHDAAQFTVFIAAIKSVERAGGDPRDRKSVMQAFRRLFLSIDHEVPTMLMQFVDAAKEEPQS